jgi:transposase InsO family protein
LLNPEISPAEQQQDQIKEILVRKVQEARAAGLTEKGVQRLERMLEEYRDVFRIEFANDPPVEVDPMKVQIKPESAPVMCKSRRYPPLHRQFLQEHMEELERNGLVERNPDSRWGSAPRIVPKKDGTLRMTVDLRGVNEVTEPRSWPMPHQEAEMADVEGSECFFGVDFFRFYWQCGMDEDSRKYFSIVTPNGIYTPSRVLMGATDAVAYCQQAVEQVVGPLLNRGAKVWLDDVLGYAKNEEELLDRLEELLKRCFRYGIKMHPLKCDFFLKIVKWCGRIISGAGVGHCPDRIRGLVEMPPPTMASDLQQFICACNWMRASIPGYNSLVEPLTTLLESCMSKAGSRKKVKLTRVSLVENGWSQDHVDALESLKKALVAMVPMAHPKDDMEVCVYTDASQDHWGAIVTQVEIGELSKSLKEQSHQPLAFLSGSFKGASSRWPIVEKEAFAIVETCKRLEYLLLRERGFHLYTDHRNLQYIFNPKSDTGTVARYQADKLQRWSMVLRMFRYKIEHVPGEDNVWGDMLSRWGATDIQPDCRVKRLLALKQVCPLEQEDFVWPTLKEIREVQLSYGLDNVDLWEDASSGCFKNRDGKMVIPEDADDLKMRLCVVAHAGRAGHRGINTTIKSLQELYFWVNMAEDVKAFIKDCLHCIVVGGNRVPRPLGSTVVATKPNEVLHMDFLKLSTSNDGFCYVLVLKDGMSGFTELIPCRGCAAEDALSALSDWFKRYGPVCLWVTDQGSHFKNRAIAGMQKVWGAEHHFVTAYCPWANGSVEVVNRVLLKVLKSMLSERKVKFVEWPKFMASVQASLNFSPSSRLGATAPITAFLGLPAPSPLKTSLVEYPATGLSVVDEVTWSAEVHQQVMDLQQSLDHLHKMVVTQTAKKNARERKRQQGKSVLPNFDVGDFVLVGRAVEVPNKLALQWRGPCRVVNAVSKWVYEVQDLFAPFKLHVVHVSRLQFYADAQRGITTDMVEYAVANQDFFLVEDLLECRQVHGRWELLVKWLGFDRFEATWEPLDSLMLDVPALVRRAVQAAKHPSFTSLPISS